MVSWLKTYSESIKYDLFMIGVVTLFSGIILTLVFGLPFLYSLILNVFQHGFGSLNKVIGRDLILTILGSVLLIFSYLIYRIGAYLNKIQ